MIKRLSIFTGLFLALSVGLPSLWARTNDLAGSSSATVLADREKATLEKHIKPVLTALNLQDAGQETKVHDILARHLAVLNAWHAQNDPQIKALWNDFNKARGRQDQTNADAALAKINAVYARLKPEHEKFISELSSVLTPEQVETVKDALTINKVKITFHAYGEIFPGLTDEQKAFILENLQAAREEAIDAGNMPEKSAFFKKYKIRIEAYLTAQGYDVKQSYKTFVAKQTAEAAAKKSAGTPPAELKR
jgi:uncharacterized Rmd1/YagE family protein